MALEYRLFGGSEEDLKDKSVGYNLLGFGANDAAEDAAKKQNDAALAGIDLQRETTGLIRGDLAPYREAGLPSLSRLSELNTAEGQKSFIQDNPFFDYLADSAGDRLFAKQAARGKLGSGETAKGLQDAVFGIGSALLQDERNSLMSMANLGQNSAAMSGNQSQAGTSAITQLLTGNANSQGAAGIAGANAQAQGASNVAGLAMMAMSAFSDVRLKENIEYVGEVNGLGWYRWDWTEEALELVGDQPAEGHLAQEVEQYRPDAIHHRDGYLAIDMEAVKNAA